MKIPAKINFAIIAIMAAVSLGSCSVEYRTRHPHHENENHERKEGLIKPIIPVGSMVAEATWQVPVSQNRRGFIN